jgi:hypothetical protein
MHGGSYKDMLVRRAQKVKEAKCPTINEPMDFLEYQNHRNRTAWKRKFNERKDST